MTKTALYRAFGDAGQLLYVGITNDPERRWREHVGAKPWWKTEVRNIDVEWFDSRTEAAKAESRAVSTEHPMYNLTLPDENGSFGYRLITSIGRGEPSKSWGTPEDHTKPRQIRIPDALWTTYADFCNRLGTTRAQDINDLIRERMERDGTEEERAAIAVADAELEERRARTGGRPPKA